MNKKDPFFFLVLSCRLVKSCESGLLVATICLRKPQKHKTFPPCKSNMGMIILCFLGGFLST